MGKVLSFNRPRRQAMAERDPAEMAGRPLDPHIIELLRQDMPSLAQTVHKHPLVYLDNAATTQRPRQVVEAMDLANTVAAGNVHRGVHLLSARATTMCEDVRQEVAAFLHAPMSEEIVFTRGTTESINLVAHSWGQAFLQHGDEIVISELEHHSNIVPWQQLCAARGAELKVVPIDDAGDVDLDAYERLLGPKTKMVALTHVSNAIGTLLPVAQMTAMAKAHGAHVLIDGAQAVLHMPIDVQAIGCDFYVFSGHKVMGPTGIGVLWGRHELLEAMPPYQTGGGMIALVSFEKTTFAPVPQRFEAGTPAIGSILGLGAALKIPGGLEWETIAEHEASLLAYAKARMAEVSGLTFVGEPRHQIGVISFTMEHAHPHDVGTILDTQGVAIRSGHHCAQPLMRRLGVASTARASFACYNTHSEIDRLIDALMRVNALFARPIT